MKKFFGKLPNGSDAYLYTITGSGLTAVVSDLGATIVRLYVPDNKGNLADVVLGFDEPKEYIATGTFFGSVIGRNANRIGGAKFSLNGREYTMDKNDNGCNNLHSGFDYYKDRLWTVENITENAICLYLRSPNGDQGFPGNADIRVTYILEDSSLKMVYEAVSDADTVFNMTNHTYFNLAGHDHPEKAMEQVLTLPSRFFTPADAFLITTGETRDVAGTPMDFRVPKPIGRDINEDYDALRLSAGYDHNYEVYTAPCAILQDPQSGRTMSVSTDCPGVQLYSGNFLMGEVGKDGVSYCRRSGVCLETQFYPNSVNHPHWQQPFTKAGEIYHSETVFKFN